MVNFFYLFGEDWPSLIHISIASFMWDIYNSADPDMFLLSCLFIVTPIVVVCNCSMFCSTLPYVPSSFAIILMGKRKLVELLSLSS